MRLENITHLATNIREQLAGHLIPPTPFVEIVFQDGNLLELGTFATPAVHSTRSPRWASKDATTSIPRESCAVARVIAWSRRGAARRRLAEGSFDLKELVEAVSRADSKLMTSQREKGKRAVVSKVVPLLVEQPKRRVEQSRCKPPLLKRVCFS